MRTRKLTRKIVRDWVPRLRSMVDGMPEAYLDVAWNTHPKYRDAYGGQPAIWLIRSVIAREIQRRQRKVASHA